MFKSILRENGIGAKDRRAALTAEFFATLDATHGNSAQSKSLTAIVKRAEARYEKVAARKAAKRAASEDAVEDASEDAAEAAPAPAPVKVKRASKVRTVESEDEILVAEDQVREAGFVARMRAAAAAAEAAGERV